MFSMQTGREIIVRLKAMDAAWHPCFGNYPRPALRLFFMIRVVGAGITGLESYCLSSKWLHDQYKRYDAGKLSDTANSYAKMFDADLRAIKVLEDGEAWLDRWNGDYKTLFADPDLQQDFATVDVKAFRKHTLDKLSTGRGDNVTSSDESSPEEELTWECTIETCQRRIRSGHTVSER